MDSHLTISQFAKSAGVTIQTVRYYERCLLLKPAARSLSRYRLYGHNEKRQLLFIKILSNGYQIQLEKCRPLDIALEARRWDLFDLLLEWGGDLQSVSVYTVLSTYNGVLYERFRAAGYDLTKHHEMVVKGHPNFLSMVIENSPPRLGCC